MSKKKFRVSREDLASVIGFTDYNYHDMPAEITLEGEEVEPECNCNIAPGYIHFKDCPLRGFAPPTGEGEKCWHPLCERPCIHHDFLVPPPPQCCEKCRENPPSGDNYCTAKGCPCHKREEKDDHAYCIRPCEHCEKLAVRPPQVEELPEEIPMTADVVGWPRVLELETKFNQLVRYLRSREGKV